MNLTTNEAIVLQQIHEDGEDDARTLSRMLECHGTMFCQSWVV